jgi:predicted PurR-regulated permease PerM
MELSELQSIWQEYDKKISQNTRLNKEILRLMLLSKPRRRLNWIRIRAVISIFSPIIFVTVLLVLKVPFHIGLSFYIGLAMFLPVYTITYIWDIEYFKLIRKIDFSMPVLTLKKEIAQLEKYKIKKTQIRYILMPFAVAGFLLMIIHSMNFSFNFVSMIPLILMILVFLSSMYITFKYSIYERFQKLNKDIDEIEQLEKE